MRIIWSYHTLEELKEVVGVHLNDKAFLKSGIDNRVCTTTWIGFNNKKHFNPLEFVREDNLYLIYIKFF